MNLVILGVIISLILSVANTILIIKQLINEFKNKPKLVIEILHPEGYQWFFKLPSSNYKGIEIRNFGFLSYVSISNRGLKETSLSSWYLDLKIFNDSFSRLHPISIPEPIVKLGKTDSVKIIPVLGVKGLFHDGKTSIKPGSHISGMSYFFASFYGDNYYNPIFKDNKTCGKFIIIDGFSKKTESDISFTELSLEKIKEMIPEIEKITENIYQE